MILDESKIIKYLGVLIVTHWKHIHDRESKRSCFVDLGPLGGTSQLPRVRRNCRWVSYRCQAQEGFQRHNGWNKKSSKIISRSYQNHINIDNIVLFHLISLGSGLIYPARCNQDSSERGAGADPMATAFLNAPGISEKTSEKDLRTARTIFTYGYGSIPINTIFRGMNIHLPAILMFTRGTRFWHTAIFYHIFTLSDPTNPSSFIDHRWVYQYLLRHFPQTSPIGGISKPAVG